MISFPNDSTKISFVSIPLFDISWSPENLSEHLLYFRSSN